MKHQTPDFIATYTGRALDFSDMKPDQIHHLDIGHALGATARFGGHTRTFYSVAQHCVLVSKLIAHRGGSREDQLYGLLHDAAEAYLGDIPTPIKQHLHDYRAVEDQLLGLIYEKYGLDPDRQPTELKPADRDLLVFEASELFSPVTFDRYFNYLPPLAPDIRQALGLHLVPFTKPAEIREAWLGRFHRLTGGIYAGD